MPDLRGARKIPMTEGVDPMALLTDDATDAGWRAEGLPADRALDRERGDHHQVRALAADHRPAAAGRQLDQARARGEERAGRRRSRRDKGWLDKVSARSRRAARCSLRT